MGISKFIEIALEMVERDENAIALSLTASAIDATAKKMTNTKKNRERYLKFLEKYMRIITFRGLPGIVASGIRIKCENWKAVKADKNGYASLEEIIYTAIRCGLIHECEIDKMIVFTDKTIIGNQKNIFMLPKELVNGLILAVILSEYNKEEKSNDNKSLLIRDREYKINDLWGKEKQFRSEYRL